MTPEGSLGVGAQLPDRSLPLPPFANLISALSGIVDILLSLIVKFSSFFYSAHCTIHVPVCFVIFRNGANVEGATHKQVVDLIRSGGDTLVLTGK